MGYLTAVNGFSYGLTPDHSAATMVQINDLNPASEGYEILLKTQDYGYPTLGFSGLNEDLSSGSANFAWIGSSVSLSGFVLGVWTDKSSVAELSPYGSPLLTQAAMWQRSGNSPNYILTPQWINHDAVWAPTHLVYANNYKFFVICGDPQAMLNSNPRAISTPVQFQFEV
ncbi:hypothetical protein FS837_001605 [Tulasnella sp. UAMH 9824]|nr:hypothetical protein FS837_001605 [Tulasnella sp. UAMH 9824]